MLIEIFGRIFGPFQKKFHAVVTLSDTGGGGSSGIWEDEDGRAHIHNYKSEEEAVSFRTLDGRGEIDFHLVSVNRIWIGRWKGDGRSGLLYCYIHQPDKELFCTDKLKELYRKRLAEIEPVQIPA